MIAMNENTTLAAMPPGALERTVRERPRPGQTVSVRTRELKGGKTDGAVIARALSADDLLDAHRFLHRMQAAQGLIEPLPQAARIGRHQAVAEMGVFSARAGAEILAVQGAIPDSEDVGLPSDEPFFIEIDALRSSGRRLCEATKVEVSVPFLKSVLPAEVMRCCVAYAEAMACDELVTAVEPWQVRYYQPMGFEQLSSVRTFSREMPFPALLMGLKLDELDSATDVGCRWPIKELSRKDYYHTKNPYRQYVDQWSSLAGEAFESPEFLEAVFATETRFLAQCSEEDLEVICGRWGEGRLGRVLQGTGTKQADGDPWRAEGLATDHGHHAATVHRPDPTPGGKETSISPRQPQVAAHSHKS